MKTWLLLALALVPLAASADGTDVPALLGRIRQTGPSEYRYEETRRLELAASPWHGEGYMFSSADGTLVKLQLQPKRVIMAIVEGRQMYYYDPEQKQRHAASVSDAGDAAGQITVFRSILQGRAEELQPGYDFAATAQGTRWTLSLTPKPGQAEEDASTVEISGADNGLERHILIRQPDGESTQYHMTKTGAGPRVEDSVRRLLLEAIGE